MPEHATDEVSAVSARRPKRKEREGFIFFSSFFERVSSFSQNEVFFFQFSSATPPSFLPSLLPRCAHKHRGKLSSFTENERERRETPPEVRTRVSFSVSSFARRERRRMSIEKLTFNSLSLSLPPSAPPPPRKPKMARGSKQKLFLAALVAGAALFAASSAPRGASATFVVAPTPPSSSSSSSSSSPANLLDLASRALANATAHKLELLVASLGQLSPPWLSQLVKEAAKRKAGLVRAEEAKVSSAFGKPKQATTTTSPAALPYASPPPDAWLAADPCHAVPSPCADTAPFTLSEVRPARASLREGGGRLPAPAHLAPLTPTAPWSQVSGPRGE